MRQFITSEKQLIDNLRKDVYCRLRPSKIHGVGVFAIRNIPKGVDPFRVASTPMLAYPESEYLHLDLKAIRKDKKIPAAVKDMLNDFCLRGEDYIEILRYGLNALSTAWYVNYSDKPNVKLTPNGFRTIRRVKAGEELTANTTIGDEL